MNRPYATISLLLASTIATFIAPSFDYSVYGFNGHPTVWLSFSPEYPWRHGGMTWIVSPFMHLNFEHLITNMALFIPLAMMMERRNSGKFLILNFFAIHLQVLLAFILVGQVHPLISKSFLGSSHVVIGLYCLWGLTNKKYSMMVLALAIIVIGHWQSQSPLSLLAHGLGLTIGIELFFIDYFWNKIRAKRAN